MAEVLLVSKPIAPPWHDSSKNLVRDLAGHMHRYRPVVLSRPGVELGFENARVECVYGAAAGGFSPALRENARVLKRLMLGRKTALWHFFFAPNPKTSGAARIAASVRRAHTVQTVCSAPHAAVKADRVLFAERVVVLSEHTRRRFLASGIENERLRLIRPSIPALTPLTSEAASAVRARLQLSADRPLVVYPGDLEFGRGADLALEAHRALPRTLNAYLIMACRAKTPRARERELLLRARARELGIEASVDFIGETPFMHDLLAVADLITLPTDSLYAKMDLPLVLVEAMALERCVLVGEGTPAEELATDGAAIKVATEAESVSEATRRLLEAPDERRIIGQQARKVVLRDYQPSRMAAEYESVYDELCA
jgi:glycosyltransferase involved in cell wall biosynthesis